MFQKEKNQDCCPTSSGHHSQRKSCCSDQVTFSRRFISKEEKKEMLEKYKEQLEKELVGVNESICKL